MYTDSILILQARKTELSQVSIHKDLSKHPPITVISVKYSRQNKPR
jgi:hypothetical protein